MVPNSQLNTQVLINLSMTEPDLLATVPVGIAYDADLDRARALLMEAARAHPKVREVAGCPVTELGDSSVTLTLRVWCRDGADAPSITNDLLEASKKALDAAGIEIPFPTRSVVLNDARPASETPATSLEAPSSEGTT